MKPSFCVCLISLSGSPTALDIATPAGRELDRGRGEGWCSCQRLRRCESFTFGYCPRPQGVRFQPLVAESTGVWDATAGRLLWLIARAAGAQESPDANLLHGELLQDLCRAMRRHRARGTPPRRPPPAST